MAGIEGRALEIPDGTRVVLDGAAGSLQMNLSDAEVEAILRRQEADRRTPRPGRCQQGRACGHGHRVTVMANIGGVQDAVDGQSRGAEGVGLLRSEFVFLNRTKAPTEDEQATVYADCARALAPGQPLVIRTLDVGGNKPLPYVPIPAEENPFLGIRGVRVGLERPELLRAQCRAIMSAADAGAELHVMFPMIATIQGVARRQAHLGR